MTACLHQGESYSPQSRASFVDVLMASRTSMGAACFCPVGLLDQTGYPGPPNINTPRAARPPHHDDRTQGRDRSCFRHAWRGGKPLARSRMRDGTKGNRTVARARRRLATVYG